MTANNTEKATFAAGCFWGTEHMYHKYFKEQDISTRVGYMGGNLDNPSYKQVKAGDTMHAEVCQILFDPSKVSFETLVEFFYNMHDPTTLNAQGPEDIGTQYRSAIFYHSEEQKVAAEKVTKEVQEKHFPDTKIVTEISPASTFYDAEDYHQLYLINNPEGYTCPTHYLRW